MEGIINVREVMREAEQRLESRERLRMTQERIEEREALYWLHRAEDSEERELVKTLYTKALERFSQRKLTKTGVLTIQLIIDMMQVYPNNNVHNLTEDYMTNLIFNQEELIELEEQVQTTIRNLTQLQTELSYDFEDTIHNLEGLLELAIKDSQAYYAKPSQEEVQADRANELQEIAGLY